MESGIRKIIKKRFQDAKLVSWHSSWQKACQLARDFRRAKNFLLPFSNGLELDFYFIFLPETQTPVRTVVISGTFL